MIKLIKWSLCRSIKAHWGMAVFIVCSVAAALFCVNVLLGYAQTEYRIGSNINKYSSLTIVDREGDISWEKIKSYVEKQVDYSISNILYFTVTAEDICLIGWDGYKQTRWFPHVSGSFFTEEQVETAQNVIYLTSDEYQELSDKNRIVMDGAEYKIVGTGWIVRSNLVCAIDNESSQTVFLEGQTKKEYSNWRERDLYIYRIIPYTTYFEQYEPEMMLLQFEYITNRQLGQVMKELKAEFPQLDITMPAGNSDEYREERKQVYGKYGVILALLVWVILINVVHEWILVNRRGYQIFRICGARRSQVCTMILLELSVLFLSGMVIAVLIQAISLRGLALLGVEDMPTVGEAVITMTILYLLSCVTSTGQIARAFSLRTERAVD